MTRPDPRIRRHSLLVLSLLALACGDSTPGTIPEWQLQEELRIGSLDDGEQALTEVPFLTVDEGGTIFVAQPEDGMVRVFSPQGELLRTLGRRGQGPGEFRGIDAVGLVGDTLFVSDIRNRRVTFFGSQGTLLETIPWNWSPIDRLFGPWRVSRITRDGSVLVDPQYGAPNAAAGRITARPILEMDWNGEVLDTLVEVSVRNTVLAVTRGDRGFVTPQPFGDAPLLGFSEDGGTVVILGRTAAANPNGAAMELLEVTAGGDTVVAVSIPYQPKPLTTDAFAKKVDELLAAASTSGPLASIPEVAEEIREAVYRPETYPPATALVVARNGWLFVRREELDEPEAVWDVLTPEGAALGRLTLAASTRLAYATDTHLWAVETDELDVPYVVRYRILQR